MELLQASCGAFVMHYFIMQNLFFFHPLSYCPLSSLFVFEFHLFFLLFFFLSSLSSVSGYYQHKSPCYDSSSEVLCNESSGSVPVTAVLG